MEEATYSYAQQILCKRSYMRFARQISARSLPYGRTSNGTCVDGIRRGLEGSYPTPLSLEVKQLERVCEVCPGSGASDDNGCCVIRPSSLKCNCAVTFLGMHG